MSTELLEQVSDEHQWCDHMLTGAPDHYILGCPECGEHMNCPAPCSEMRTDEFLVLSRDAASGRAGALPSAS